MLASVLDEAVEKNIRAEQIGEWITQTPNGINGIYERRRQRKQTEQRAAKGLPPLPTKEQQQLAYDELLSIAFISEHELPEVWRDHKATDPGTRVAADAFEVALAARFENGKFKIRGYFVPGSHFWIREANELLRSRGVDPNGDSSLRKNPPEEPCAPDPIPATVENVPDRAIDMDARSQEQLTLIEQHHSPPPAQGLAVTTEAHLSSTVIENSSSALALTAAEPSKIKADGPPVCEALGRKCQYVTCKERGRCLKRATRGYKAWDRRIQHQIRLASEHGEIITPQEARRRIGRECARAVATPLLTASGKPYGDRQG